AQAAEKARNPEAHAALVGPRTLRRAGKGYPQSQACGADTKSGERMQPAKLRCHERPPGFDRGLSLEAKLAEAKLADSPGSLNLLAFLFYLPAAWLAGNSSA